MSIATFYFQLLSAIRCRTPARTALAGRYCFRLAEALAQTPEQSVARSPKVIRDAGKPAHEIINPDKTRVPSRAPIGSRWGTSTG